jgi:Uma2 family endonuclease
MRGAERRVRAIESPERLLFTGQRLTQERFHALYEQTPKHFRADLVNGVVYVSSPLRNPHGRWHKRILGILCDYEEATPGVEAFINTSLIVDHGNEPQPDATLCIEPELGGASDETEDEYMTGSPEMVIEVADTSKRLDLGEKRLAYQDAGVLAYIVVNIPDRKVHLFDLKKDLELKPGADGVLRSQVFPGLWIGTKQFFDRSSRGCREVLEHGLASPEHARFVKRLQRRRKKRES